MRIINLAEGMLHYSLALQSSRTPLQIFLQSICNHQQQSLDNGWVEEFPGGLLDMI